jgi:pimeloyl-ACP methyl ester carboxylesterase
MVNELHLKETFIKTYTADANKHLLFLLAGQSLSPRVFWDYPTDEGSHAQWFLSQGIDVVLFDPVGYGNSKAFYPYDRIDYARQIIEATEHLKDYEVKTIFGFSTSTAPAIIASQQYFNKVIIHSPVLRQDPKYFVPHQDVLNVSIEKLIKDRIGNISDKLIPKSNRVDNWQEKILSVIGKTEWQVPAKVVHDVGNFYPKRHSNGFIPDMVPPILSIVGQYDYEVTTGGYALFKTYFPDIKEVIIPNSTHFSMWENEYKVTLQAVRDYIKA